MYKLIIVDDDELIRKGLEKVIPWESMGFSVAGIFKSAVEALAFLKIHRVDVILTDIRMPEMSGLELIDKAKMYRQEIKSVVISGYSEFELAKKALRLKVEDYLLKPLGEEEIEAAFLKVKKILDREQWKNDIEGGGRERNVYKKEWDYIQILKNRMIDNFENGRFQEINQQVDEINQILENYDSKDIYYFYCNIVMKLLKYFELENRGGIYLFAHRNFADGKQQYPTPAQLRKNFAQDIDTIRKALWENSDSMRNLMVAKAKAMIEKEYSNENLTLAFVANQLNISYGYLSTIFTKSEGRSFKAYLVEVRMEKARILLLSRCYRIYEIAEMVGYKNPRYFTDAFKKYYQYSPMDYIARFRGDEKDESTYSD